MMYSGGQDTTTAKWRITVERREFHSWRWTTERWVVKWAGSEEWKEVTTGHALTKAIALRRARKALPVATLIKLYD